jgi:hypothetical protein
MDSKIWMTDDLEQMAQAGQDAVFEATVRHPHQYTLKPTVPVPESRSISPAQ